MRNPEDARRDLDQLLRRQMASDLATTWDTLNALWMDEVNDHPGHEDLTIAMGHVRQAQYHLLRSLNPT